MRVNLLKAGDPRSRTWSTFCLTLNLNEINNIKMLVRVKTFKNKDMI